MFKSLQRAFRGHWIEGMVGLVGEEWRLVEWGGKGARFRYLGCLALQLNNWSLNNGSRLEVLSRYLNSCGFPWTSCFEYGPKQPGPGIDKLWLRILRYIWWWDLLRYMRFLEIEVIHIIFRIVSGSLLKSQVGRCGVLIIPPRQDFTSGMGWIANDLYISWLAGWPKMKMY